MICSTEGRVVFTGHTNYLSINANFVGKAWEILWVLSLPESLCGLFDIMVVFLREVIEEPLFIAGGYGFL